MRRAAALLALLLAAGPALACGVCVEDKIASCYDHAVVSQARTQGVSVAFFAIVGDVIRTEETRKALLQAIDATPGVRKGTARVSLENAALSFAFDPARLTVEDAERRLGARLAPRGLRVGHLRTL
jgi:hypothetical protein